MSSYIKINVVFASLLLCFVAFSASAQRRVGSDKTLNKNYNKNITKKLNEWSKSKHVHNPQQNEKDLPSSQSSLKNMAKLKNKNPEIVPHDNSAFSNEEKKAKLPSANPEKLKELAHSVMKQPISSGK